MYVCLENTKTKNGSDQQCEQTAVGNELCVYVCLENTKKAHNGSDQQCEHTAVGNELCVYVCAWRICQDESKEKV